MGTNYYLSEGACPHCKRGKSESLHIGKSSAGWVFSLHVIPEQGINDLDDWAERWSKDDAVIADEYGRQITKEEMLLNIVGRFSKSATRPRDFLDRNQAVQGPFGLMRHRIDGRHCIAHGAGTYDLMPGEFS